MASFLFMCVKCLGQRRIVGISTEPPEFDFICDDCKEESRVAAEKLEQLSRPPARRSAR